MSALLEKKNNTFLEINSAEVRDQLTRILKSRTFARASYLTRFLKRSVEETLDGNSGQLKELWLGPVVFQRDGRFDPTRDPIVRVQARRLRQKLELFYETEGLFHPIRISFPVGSYVPVFSTMNLGDWPEMVAGMPHAIAVLPLTPLDDDAQSARFAEAMTAELTHGLVDIGGFEVVSRAPSWAHRGVSSDFVMEGSVRLADSNHKISLQVTDAKTGCHCWSAWFEQRNTRMDPDVRRIAELLNEELSASRVVRSHEFAVAHASHLH